MERQFIAMLVAVMGALVFFASRATSNPKPIVTAIGELGKYWSVVGIAAVLFLTK